MVLEKTYQEYIAKKGNRVISIHPPTLNLSLKIEDSEVIASPYKAEATISVVI